MLAPRQARVSSSTVPTLMFMVRWDEGWGEYVALDTCGTVLGSSREKFNAIASARRAATVTREAGVSVLVMVEGNDGRLRRDWEAEPGGVDRNRI
jgi:hypothetical protein